MRHRRRPPSRFKDHLVKAVLVSKRYLLRKSDETNTEFWDQLQNVEIRRFLFMVTISLCLLLNQLITYIYLVGQNTGLVSFKLCP
jgi:hypothetical protein